MGAATLSIGVDLPISDGRTQHYAMDSGSTLYDIDAVYGDLAEFDALAYKFYADITEGVNQPVALAAFPTRSAR